MTIDMSQFYQVFFDEADELLAETRKGRGVMTTRPGVRLAVVREIPPEHDHAADTRIRGGPAAPGACHSKEHSVPPTQVTEEPSGTE